MSISGKLIRHAIDPRIFRSTRPRGARPCNARWILACSCVSIHAPPRGATLWKRRWPGLSTFRSTRPRGARPSRSKLRRRVRRFRSTRPRGARLDGQPVVRHVRFVSIHAPPRGATYLREQGQCRHAFRSTRPRGARLAPRRSARANCAFRSTRPRGARLAVALARLGAVEVSIHAPPRGATRDRVVSSPLLAFRSTRPRGARPIGSIRGHIYMGFDPRAPAGRDHRRFGGPNDGGSFDPRAPAGRDLNSRRQNGVCRVSIHAPPRGATPVVPGPVSHDTVSIHAPPRGATRRAARSFW